MTEQATTPKTTPRMAQELLAWFKPGMTAMVAFSGGVDSGLVTAAAARALGADNVVAATAISSALASGECESAAKFASSIGVRHVPIATNEVEVEGYQANKAQRCYFCKATILDILGELANRQNADVILTGTNADDILARFRPGMRASMERGAQTPLADVGISKNQVRAISKMWGLSLADKPATACLSSRVAYGIRITPERLARVDRAEDAVRQLLTEIGVSTYDLRVRDLGNRARVEVDSNIVNVLTNSVKLQQVLVSVGFPDEFVDVRAFQSGSLNAALSKRSSLGDRNLAPEPKPTTS